MIAITRSKDAPSFSSYPVLRKLRAGIKEHYKKPLTTRRQQMPDYIQLPSMFTNHESSNNNELIAIKLSRSFEYRTSNKVFDEGFY